jgi:hypothetical protein
MFHRTREILVYPTTAPCPTELLPLLQCRFRGSPHAFSAPPDGIQPLPLVVCASSPRPATEQKDIAQNPIHRADGRAPSQNQDGRVDLSHCGVPVREPSHSFTVVRFSPSTGTSLRDCFPRSTSVVTHKSLPRSKRPLLVVTYETAQRAAQQAVALSTLPSRGILVVASFQELSRLVIKNPPFGRERDSSWELFFQRPAQVLEAARVLMYKLLNGRLLEVETSGV